MTWPPHQMTWHASKQVTSPPWNSRRLVHSKEMVWASRWSVALRTFYRQSSFFFWNFRPRLARELLVYLWYSWKLDTDTGNSHIWKETHGHTVDGSEIRLTSWYGKYPIIYRVSAPSQVVGTGIPSINSTFSKLSISVSMWNFGVNDPSSLDANSIQQCILLLEVMNGWDLSPLMPVKSELRNIYVILLSLKWPIVVHFFIVLSLLIGSPIVYVGSTPPTQ